MPRTGSGKAKSGPRFEEFKHGLSPYRDCQRERERVDEKGPRDRVASYSVSNPGVP